MTDRPDLAALSDGALAARIRRGRHFDRSPEPHARDDEESVLAELHRRHQDAVLTYARRYAAGPDATRALAAEAFGDTVTAVRTGQGPTEWWRGRLAAAVEQAASRWSAGPRGAELQTDVRRRYGLLQQGAQPDPTESADHGLSAHCFMALPGEAQAVLWLRLVDQQSPREVAVVLGVAPEQVDPLTARALELLRAAWLGAYCARHRDDDCRHYGRLLVAAARSPDRPVHGLRQHVDACESCRSVLGDLRQIDSVPGELLRAAFMPGAAGDDEFDAAASSAPVVPQPGARRPPGAATVKSPPRWRSWPTIAGCCTAVAAIATLCGTVLVPAREAGGVAGVRTPSPSASSDAPTVRTPPPSASPDAPTVRTSATAATAAPTVPDATSPTSPSTGQDVGTASVPTGTGATTAPAQHSDQAATPASTPALPPTPTPAAASATPTDAGLVNGGAESGALAPWRAYNSARADTSTPRTGLFALRLGAHPSGAEQDLVVAPNTTYRLSGWTVVTTDGDLATLGVKNYGGPELRDPVGSTGYTYRAIEFTTGPTSSRATVYCFKVTGTAAAHCDDLTVVRL